MNRNKRLLTTKNLVLIAMFGAVSAVLMYIEIPIAVIAPPFYKLDFSEVPVLIGTFALGPVAGIFIELIKILIKLIIKGTETAYVGDLANFLIGCSFIVPAGILYRKIKTKKGALMGLICGTICMMVVGAVLNAFVLLPWYANNMAGFSMQMLIDMGTAVNSNINSVFTFVMLAVTPFNLIKGIVVGVITMLLYKRIVVLLRISSTN